MHILTINTGSSSIKFSLYEFEEERLHIKGQIDRIGNPPCGIRILSADGSILKEGETTLRGFKDGAALIADWLNQMGYADSIVATGYRIVHGGTRYREHCPVTEELVSYLKAISHLAPEHLPQEVEVIEELSRHLVRTEAVACFDTAFHRDIITESKLYAIPFEFYEDGIMRYGFHGLSYEYITEELSLKEIPLDRVIIAHLGHGASMAAIKDGRCIDTTMGFTPAAGLVMSTRCGDMDPGVILYLMKEKGISVDELNTLLNHHSGLLGISGVSDDVRELLTREEEDERAALSLRLFCHSARKFIGSLSATLGGLSTLVFTAGIGENSPEIRERILSGLEFLGIRLDVERNRKNQRFISTPDSPVRVVVLKTDEECMIARHTKRILKREGR